MHSTPSEMRACTEACLSCYRTCLGMASDHCLPAGGKHVEPQHFRLMLACAEICRTSAHFLLLGLPEHRSTCRTCAEVCQACAASCATVGGMDDCVAECRRCAEMCREMAA